MTFIYVTNLTTSCVIPLLIEDTKAVNDLHSRSNFEFNLCLELGTDISV